MAKENSTLLQVLVGQDALMATPAMSSLIRRRKLYGEQFDEISHCLVQIHQEGMKQPVAFGSVFSFLSLS